MSAGMDRGYFTLEVQGGAGSWHQKLFDKKDWPACEALIGKHVELVIETNAKNAKYTDFVSIKEIVAPEGNAPAKSYGRQYDEDTIGRQKARCNLFQSACNLVGAIYPKESIQTPESIAEIVITFARAGEKYVYEPTLAEVAVAMGATRISLEDEFNELVLKNICVDPKSPAGVGVIKNWLKNNGYKVETFKELSATDQDAACATMRLLFAPQK